MDRTGLLNEIVGKLGEVLPSGASELKQDFEKNARSVVQSAIEKMDLVTREEFDLQVALLQRTREKVDRLEKLLESQNATSDSGGSNSL
ncbi:MAG: accessory factor UbiK family protein [Pseudomonadota bacterium]